MPFHWATFCSGWRSLPLMSMTENKTSIQPSRETISKRIKIACLKESKAQVLSNMPGFDHTRGVKNNKESFTGELPKTPKQSALPRALESLQEYRSPENMFKLQVSNIVDKHVNYSPPYGERNDVQNHQN